MRWVPSRKAAVVREIEEGRLTAAEACTRYELSTEELAAWQTAYAQHGSAGLRATRLQIYTRRQVRGAGRDRWARSDD